MCCNENRYNGVILILQLSKEDFNPETDVIDVLLTYVSVKPLDIFWETFGHFPVVFVERIPNNFHIFVGDKTG